MSGFTAKIAPLSVARASQATTEDAALKERISALERQVAWLTMQLQLQMQAQHSDGFAAYKPLAVEPLKLRGFEPLNPTPWRPFDF